MGAKILDTRSLLALSLSIPLTPGDVCYVSHANKTRLPGDPGPSDVCIFWLELRSEEVNSPHSEGYRFGMMSLKQTECVEGFFRCYFRVKLKDQLYEPCTLLSVRMISVMLPITVIKSKIFQVSRK